MRHRLHRRILVAAGLLLILSGPLVLLRLTKHFIDRPGGTRRLQAVLTGTEYLGSEGVVLQNKSYDCGPAALMMILNHYGIPGKIDDLERELETKKNGTTMLKLKQVLETRGLYAEGWKLASNDLENIQLPAIAYINGNHYVVLEQITADWRLTISDPALGRLKMRKWCFLMKWRGEILIVSRQPRGRSDSIVTQ
jgi:uncharacterized protein